MNTMYYAAQQGFINGAYRNVGDEVGRLSDLESKYLKLQGLITATAPPAAEAEKKPAKAPAADKAAE